MATQERLSQQEAMSRIDRFNIELRSQLDRPRRFLRRPNAVRAEAIIPGTKVVDEDKVDDFVNGLTDEAPTKMVFDRNWLKASFKFDYHEGLKQEHPFPMSRHAHIDIADVAFDRKTQEPFLRGYSSKEYGDIVKDAAEKAGVKVDERAFDYGDPEFNQGVKDLVASEKAKRDALIPSIVEHRPGLGIVGPGRKALKRRG